MPSKQQFIMQIKHPAAIIGFVVALVWIVQDVSERVFKAVPVTKSQKIADMQGIKTQNLNLRDDQIADILSLFEVYKPSLEVEKEEKPIGLTKEEQLKQSGVLTEVFIDNKKLVLKAIIQPNETQNRVALINVLNTDSSETTLERFDDKTQVFGFELQVLNNTQVKLTANRELQKQEIILSMFKNIEPSIESQ